jgi:hypothetical protein
MPDKTVEQSVGSHQHISQWHDMWSIVLSTAVQRILTVVTGAIYLLPVPRTGLLAVLWWAAILAFFILAALYTIRTGLIAKRGGRAVLIPALRK